MPARRRSWPGSKSRWREENFLKHASENYGIDKICDYIAGIETTTAKSLIPGCKKANAAVRDAEKAVAAAERDLAALSPTRPSARPPRHLADPRRAGQDHRRAQETRRRRRGPRHHRPQTAA